MLVLSRKEGQSIRVIFKGGKEVELIVVKVSGSRIKLGVKAPKEVKIIRNELVAGKEEKE